MSRPLSARTRARCRPDQAPAQGFVSVREEGTARGALRAGAGRPSGGEPGVERGCAARSRDASTTNGHDVGPVWRPGGDTGQRKRDVTGLGS